MSDTEKSPAWLPLIVAFAAGFAIASAIFGPAGFTPEFQRGYDSGFNDGYTDLAKRISTVTLEQTKKLKP